MPNEHRVELICGRHKEASCSVDSNQRIKQQSRFHVKKEDPTDNDMGHPAVL